MPDFPFPVARVGIVGGGQLARMMVVAAHRLGVRCLVLDPDPDSPASQVGAETLIGDFHDPEKLRELVQSCDVTTFDFEAVDSETLISLVDQEHQIHPSPRTLAIIQDKYTQKRLYADAGIATPAFEAVDIPDAETFARFGYPLVQKARRGGYDGRGVAIMHGPEDFAAHLSVPSIIERFVPAQKEIAVLVARGRDGDIRCYPVAEMHVHPDQNMLDVLLCPAQVSEAISRKAQDLATRAVDALGGNGLFGVEMFLSETGDLSINEIAPRTHNSGHHTIEACVTDQFEQHLRAVLGLPLGSTTLLHSAATINLLGAPGSAGKIIIEGFAESLEVAGASIHLYGKTTTRPYRKMGHVTVLDTDLDRARKHAEQVRDQLIIKGEDPL